MTQSFKGGVRTPVTLIKAGPNVVTHVKTEEKDGYWAVQLGFGTKKIKNVTKPLKGHLKGAVKDKTAPRFLREVKVSTKPEVKVGDTMKLSDVFNVGDIVSVTGVSKGKGFAGVVKRWGFAGGPKTHGQSDRHRAPGSIGQGTDPGRVWKGKKMAGRMGTVTTHIGNLKVVSIDEENGVIGVSGPVPGRREGLVVINLIKKSEEKEPEAIEVETKAEEKDTAEKTVKEDKKESSDVKKEE